MIIIKLNCEINFLMHLINIINDKIVLKILKKLYKKTNLSIINIFHKKINQFNLKKNFNIETYNEHLKNHKKKLFNSK